MLNLKFAENQTQWLNINKTKWKNEGVEKQWKIFLWINNFFVWRHRCSSPIVEPKKIMESAEVQSYAFHSNADSLHPIMIN